MINKSLGGESAIVLIDNGSLNPKSVIEARSLAESFAQRLQQPAVSLSVSHSDAIPASELDGEPAMLWESYLENAASNGIRQIYAIPLFIGPGFGLKKAKRMALKRAKAGERVIVRWADPIVSETDQDTILQEILVENVLRVLDTSSRASQVPRVLLVDHGSPFEEVTSCRNYAALLLQDALGNRVESVIGCSMERREGKEFDFNEPSLERALAMAKRDEVDRIVLCYLFLFSGRHAGPGGDIDQICEKEGWKSGQNLLKTDLIGSNPKALDLLETRLNSILSKV